MRYDFHCGSCDITFEVARPMREAGNPAFCPECDVAARRIFSTSPIIWRPEGWDLSPDDPRYFDVLEKPEERPLCQQ